MNYRGTRFWHTARLNMMVWAAVRPVPSWCIKSNSARSPGGWWRVRPGTFQTACWQAVSSECAEGCCRDSGTLACWIDVLLVDFGVLSELLACKSLTFHSFHALKGSRLSRLSKRWGNTIWTESQLTCIPLAEHWQSIGWGSGIILLRQAEVTGIVRTPVAGGVGSNANILIGTLVFVVL